MIPIGSIMCSMVRGKPRASGDDPVRQFIREHLVE